MEKFVKLINKKLSIGFVAAILATAISITYVISYSSAVNKFNQVVAYLNERQAMYTKLSQIDQAIRQDYIGSIDENKLKSSVCTGYLSGIDDSNIVYFSAEDYDKYVRNKSVKNNTDSIGSLMLSEKTGLIAIYSFNNRTFGQFKDAIKNLSSSGMEKLVIDIRNNDSDNTEVVSKVLGEILPSGEILSTIDKMGTKEILYTSDGGELNLPLVVITDNGTKSGAEVFASAIKDYNKGALIGGKTAGEGYERKIISLSDGSVLSIPRANYVTLSGNIFTGSGIEPDVKVEMSDETKELLLNHSLSPFEDPQILESLKILG